MTESVEQRDVLGLDRQAGDRHYRAYVGPPQDYDLVAAMSFGLLTCLGLRQHHAVLDVGCGSLRVGRLLIPYLNEGRYTGIEPNRWLVEEGIQRETGGDQVRVKRATFVYSSSPDALDATARFDFVLAQSIFSHAGLDQIDRWLGAMARHLNPDGAMVATFVEGEQDYSGSGWVYPDCVTYRASTLTDLADQHGLQWRALDWSHPRQSWILFARAGFDLQRLVTQTLDWNGSLASGQWD